MPNLCATVLRRVRLLLSAAHFFGKRGFSAVMPTVFFIALATWTIYKGFLPIFEADEMYFWLSSYAGGLARRSFIGTLLLPLTAGANASKMHMIGAALSLAALIILVLFLADTLRGDFRDAALSRRIALILLTASAPLLGLMAFHIGYPDGITGILLLQIGRSFKAGSAPAVAVMLLIAGLIHEIVPLLLVPLALLTVCIRTDWTRRDRIMLVSGVFCSLALPLLSRSVDPNLTAHLISTGLSSAVAQDQASTFLHQSLPAAISKMLVVWSAYPVNGLIGIVYGGLPAVFLLLLFLPDISLKIFTSHQNPWLRRLLLLLYAVAGLAPLFLLAIAWDLARLSAFSILTAIVTARLGIMRSAPAFGRVTPSVAVLLAAIYLLLPIQNLYFDYGRPLKTRILGGICLPCLSLVLTADDYFNRNLTQPERTQIDTDPLYGNRLWARTSMY